MRIASGHIEPLVEPALPICHPPMPFQEPGFGYRRLVFIQDVEVTGGAAALLALLLHRGGYQALSERIGRAVDTDMHGLSLSGKERSVVLDVLVHSPVSLERLRDRLSARNDALP